MCGHCEMRFTTRSNLLRHANRRHGAIRDASELRRVLVTLTPRQQQEHAEKEAQKIADQSAAFREEPSVSRDVGFDPMSIYVEVDRFVCLCYFGAFKVRGVVYVIFVAF